MHATFVSLTGLIVGFTVGLTGMGGGALMTPMLVLLLGVNPLVAVSSDLVTAAVVKPVGAVVHLRRGTVHWSLVAWLCAGSIPAAIAGALVLGAVGVDPGFEHRMRIGIGAALLVAVAAIAAKSVLATRRSAPTTSALRSVRVRRGATLAIGMLGGIVVSTTSVGSGSLMVVLLLLVYPAMSSKQLVSTDLWQAIPLVVTAALGHLLVGRVDFSLVALLLVGSVPGVVVGARVSAGASERLVRDALVLVLAVSGLRMIGVPTVPVLAALAVGAVGLGTRSVAARRRARALVLSAP